MKYAASLPPVRHCNPMIVCHCNLITERDIEDAVLELLRKDEWQVIVPNQVYACLGKTVHCGGCLPNTMEIIIRTVAAYRAQKESPSAEVIPFRQRLRKRQDEAIQREDEVANSKPGSTQLD